MLEKGQIVFSRKGRDVTHVYAVCGIQGDRVLVADGVKRPMCAPKPKNIRHINPTGTILSAGQMESDLSLKRALAAYVAEITRETSGG